MPALPSMLSARFISLTARSSRKRKPRSRPQRWRKKPTYRIHRPALRGPFHFSKAILEPGAELEVVLRSPRQRNAKEGGRPIEDHGIAQVCAPCPVPAGIDFNHGPQIKRRFGQSTCFNRERGRHRG